MFFSYVLCYEATKKNRMNNTNHVISHSKCTPSRTTRWQPDKWGKPREKTVCRDINRRCRPQETWAPPMTPVSTSSAGNGSVPVYGPFTTLNTAAGAQVVNRSSGNVDSFNVGKVYLEAFLQWQRWRFWFGISWLPLMTKWDLISLPPHYKICIRVLNF